MSADKMENRLEGWLAQWEAAARRYDELTHRLADPTVLSEPPVVIAYNKERADLEDVSQLFADYRRLLQEIANTSRMLDDPQLDPELKALATDELGALQEQRTRVEERALQLLHPRNAEDDKNSFVDIRAGTQAADEMPRPERYVLCLGPHRRHLTAHRAAAHVGRGSEAIAGLPRRADAPAAALPYVQLDIVDGHGQHPQQHFSRAGLRDRKLRGDQDIWRTKRVMHHCAHSAGQRHGR